MAFPTPFRRYIVSCSIERLDRSLAQSNSAANNARIGGYADIIPEGYPSRGPNAIEQSREQSCTHDTTLTLRALLGRTHMSRFVGFLLGIATTLLWIQLAACFAVRTHSAAVSSIHRTSALRSRVDTRVGTSGLEMLQRHHKGCRARRNGGTSRSSRGAQRTTKLQISEEDRERDLKFEQDLDRDAQLWVQGDPAKQKLWDRAKAWRNLNKSEC